MRDEQDRAQEDVFLLRIFSNRVNRDEVVREIVAIYSYISFIKIISNRII